MSIVYLAEHRTLHNKVAIKLLNKELLENDNIRKRFLAEARNMARMSHPNIVKVTDLIETDKEVAFVMEYIEGENLKDYILRIGKLSDAEVHSLLLQMLDGIEYIHTQNLVHRDIKPSNFVFGNEDNTNKLFLIDLGFAKRYDYNGIHIEEKNIKHIIGSLNFVSINVHRHIEPSRRDDIESCIYVILTMLLGDLKWFKETDINKMALLKRDIINDNIPIFIKKMLTYIRSIDFDATPDYDNGELNVTIRYYIVGIEAQPQQLSFALQPTR
jgi:serine/threonine protein kinase